MGNNMGALCCSLLAQDNVCIEQPAAADSLLQEYHGDD